MRNLFLLILFIIFYQSVEASSKNINDRRLEMIKKRHQKNSPSANLGDPVANLDATLDAMQAEIVDTQAKLIQRYQELSKKKELTEAEKKEFDHMGKFFKKHPQLLKGGSVFDLTF